MGMLFTSLQENIWYNYEMAYADDDCSVALVVEQSYIHNQSFWSLTTVFTHRSALVCNMYKG